MKSMPALSAKRARLRQSGQLADQRSGTLVAARPDEQFAPKMPTFSALPLYMAMRSRIDPVRADKALSVGAGRRRRWPPCRREANAFSISMDSSCAGLTRASISKIESTQGDGLPGQARQ